MNNTKNQPIIKKKDGTERQGMGEMLKRWEEWTKERFSKEQNEMKPKITYIAEQEWGNNFIEAPRDLHRIREKSALMKITREQPEIETWLNQDYAEQDIDIELRNLALDKSHGNDGIPGEAYEATREWAIKPIAKIMNLIKN